MMLLHFDERPLVNRLVAKEDLANALERIKSSADDTVVVDLGSNVATTSWVDGFLVPFMTSAGRTVTVIAASEVSRAHIARVFAARGLCVAVARSADDIARGVTETVPAA
jgi:hypothetical protein